MRFARVILIAISVVVPWPIPAVAQNGSIEIVPIDNQQGGAPLFGQCTGNTLFFPGIFGTIEFGIYAHLEGQTTAGISGAELRVVGAESFAQLGWSISVTSSVGSVNVEDPMLPSENPPGSGSFIHRGQIAFVAPQTGDTAGFVELYRVVISGAPPVADIPPDTRLRVVTAVPPSDPSFSCPVLTLPDFTRVCVDGGQFIINPVNTDCTDVQMTSRVVGTGGGSLSNSNYAVVSTLGQAVVGEFGGSSYTAFVGHYVPGEFVTVDVKEVEPPSVPQSYRLMQNYPNPFNPVTTIGFSLPERSRAKVTVMDASGRLVRTVVDRVFDAGAHNVTFDGTGLASGVYFYRLHADTYIETRRLVILK